MLPAMHTLPLHDPDSWRFLYGRWKGRVSRRSFWLHGVVGLIGLGLLLRALLEIAGMSPDRADGVVSLVTLYLGAAVSAKRWQDRGRSPWWVLLLLVPVVGVIWTLLDNGFVRGTPGPNAYGPPPPTPPAWLR
jgi:uncharacterized membrane protein YhaH (DUF805 family)